MRVQGAHNSLSLLVPYETQTWNSPHVGNVLLVGGSVRAWTILQGVTIEAVTPKREWRIAADVTTGILLANPDKESVNIQFELRGQIATGQLTGEASTAFFVTKLFTDVGGTLIIRSNKPIGVWSAKCAATCVGHVVD